MFTATTWLDSSDEPASTPSSGVTTAQISSPLSNDWEVRVQLVSPGTATPSTYQAYDSSTASPSGSAVVVEVTTTSVPSAGSSGSILTSAIVGGALPSSSSSSPPPQSGCPAQVGSSQSNRPSRSLSASSVHSPGSSPSSEEGSWSSSPERLEGQAASNRMGRSRTSGVLRVMATPLPGALAAVDCIPVARAGCSGWPRPAQSLRRGSLTAGSFCVSALSRLRSASSRRSMRAQPGSVHSSSSAVRPSPPGWIQAKHLRP